MTARYKSMKRYLLTLIAAACLVLAAAPAAHAATSSQAKRAATAKLQDYYGLNTYYPVSVRCKQRTRTRFECSYGFGQVAQVCGDYLYATGWVDVTYPSGYSRPFVSVDERRYDCAA